jgi:hypothetical protein
MKIILNLTRAADWPMMGLSVDGGVLVSTL